MKILKQALCALWLLPVSLPAFADNVTYGSIREAAQSSTDLSRQALITIFGDVVTDPFSASSPTIIGSLFGILNGIICSIALFWFLSVTLKGVVKTGTEGRVFGNTRTMMAPVFSFGAFIGLVPGASGWSLAQLIVLWAGSIMGVGGANLLTNKAVDMLSMGHSLVVQPTAPVTRDAAHSIFEMNLCKYAYNNDLARLSNDSGPSATGQMTTTGSQGDYVTGNGSAICGTAKIPTTTRSSKWSSIFDDKVDTETIVTAQKTALDTMQSTLDKAASEFVNTYIEKRNQDTGNLPDTETVIQNAASAYETTVSTAINSLDYKDTLQESLNSNIKTYGWVALGAWYQTFATANAKTNDVAASAPQTSGQTFLGENGGGKLFDEVFTAYRTQLQNSTYTPVLGTQTSKMEITAGSSTEPKSVFVGLFNSPMQRFVNYIATTNVGSNNQNSNQVNPMIKMQTVGNYTLDVVGVALTGYVTAQTISAAAGKNIIGRTIDNLTGWQAAIAAVLTAIAPPFYFLLLILFSIGMSLSVFIPAIPFIYWMTAFLNWSVSVLVGCAAGPAWAATHLGAEEDRGSRAAYGYIFLIDAMLRPSLMVLGFFFASVCIIAGGTVLDVIFGAALANAQIDSLTGLFIAVGWLNVYARICTFSVTKAFSLPVVLPDHVINFLGGRDGANLMGGMADSVKNQFLAFGSGSQKTPGMNVKERDNSANTDGFRK